MLEVGGSPKLDAPGLWSIPGAVEIVAAPWWGWGLLCFAEPCQ